MRFRVTFYDSLDNVVEGEVFELNVPEGGSKDDETDDNETAAKVVEYVERFVRSMTAGGCGWSVRAEEVVE